MCLRHTSTLHVVLWFLPVGGVPRVRLERYSMVQCMTVDASLFFSHQFNRVFLGVWLVSQRVKHAGLPARLHANANWGPGGEIFRAADVCCWWSRRPPCLNILRLALQGVHPFSGPAAAIISPVQQFLAMSVTGGLLMLCCARDILGNLLHGTAALLA